MLAKHQEKLFIWTTIGSGRHSFKVSSMRASEHAVARQKGDGLL